MSTLLYRKGVNSEKGFVSFHLTEFHENTEETLATLSGSRISETTVYSSSLSLTTLLTSRPLINIYETFLASFITLDFLSQMLVYI
jgi:hypothetical protein